MTQPTAGPRGLPLLDVIYIHEIRVLLFCKAFQVSYSQCLSRALSANLDEITDQVPYLNLHFQVMHGAET
jgi:hypothetical protein